MKIITNKVMETITMGVVSYPVGEKFRSLIIEMSESEAYYIKEDIETLEKAIKSTIIVLADDHKISVATLNLLQGIRIMYKQKPLE